VALVAAWAATSARIRREGLPETLTTEKRESNVPTLSLLLLVDGKRIDVIPTRNTTNITIMRFTIQIAMSNVCPYLMTKFDMEFVVIRIKYTEDCEHEKRGNDV